MPRNLLSVTSGVLLFSLLLIFSIIAWNRDPQSVVTQQAASDACLSESDASFVFDFYGYIHNEDGTTTLTYRVSNPNKKDISYVAFGTGDWVRVEPSDGVTTTLALGPYHVEWTNDRGNPGFTSVKYETLLSGFSKGASESFTLVVSNFDPEATVQVEAKAGRDLGRVSFALSTPACDKTPPTPTPTPPFSPLPTPTPTPEGGVILPTEPVVAECVFGPPVGGLPPDEPVIPLSAYSFSEPTSVLTNTYPIGIQQWLSDSETLLIVQYGKYGNSTELVNSQTGEISHLIGPDQSFKDPRWLSQDNTLVWGALGTSNRKQGYWVHSFDPPREWRLTDEEGWPQHDISPDGKEFIFMSRPGGTQPYVWNQETKSLRVLPVDLSNWRYGNGNIYFSRPFNINWQPSGDKILFWDGTWVFLYELTTNHGCEINMRHLAGVNDSIIRASWSPNGRYLMAQLTQDPPGTTLNGPYDLLWILDIYTGDVVEYNLGTAVYSFSWAPDNQTVIVEEKSDRKIDGFALSMFYLLNIHSGEHTPILTEGTVLGASGKRVLWSSDGTKVAHQCKNTAATATTPYIDRICISYVAAN